MILSDNDIKKYMEDGDIIISDFSGELEPASYDMRIGDSAIDNNGVHKIDEYHHITIKRGSTVVVFAHENICLSTRVCARFGLRSHLARKGLILLSGPQIDPGYKGVLSFNIYNAGTADVILTVLEPFATVEFNLLKTPASKEYSGRFKDTPKISSEEIEFATKKHRSLDELEDAVKDLNNQLGHIMTFVYVVIFGIILASVSLILDNLLDDTVKNKIGDSIGGLLNNACSFNIYTLINLIILAILIVVISYGFKKLIEHIKGKYLK